MNEPRISPDDPRLTAYALGELEGDERAEVEAALRHDPAARAQVEAIRAMAADMEAALAAEAAADDAGAGTRHVERAAGEGGGEQESDEAEREAGSPRVRRASVLRFPQVYYLIGGLAAACFAIYVAVQPPRPERPEVRRVEITLAPAAGPEVLQLPGAGEDRRRESEERLAAAVTEPLTLPEIPVERRTTPQNAGSFRSESPATAPERVAQTLAVASEVAQAAEQASAATATLDLSVPDAVDAAALRAAAADALATTIEPDRVVKLSPYEVTMDRERGVTVEAGAARSAARRSPAAVRPAAPRGARFAEDGVADAEAKDNAFVGANENPLSTFPVEVEAASYAQARRFLEAGRLPPRDAVRIEELLNYFPYRYAEPPDEMPFAAELAVTEAPWAPAHRLVRIALKGRDAPEGGATHRRAPANLVFLLDVSGSMETYNKLPAVQDAIRRLVTRLRPEDRVAIVTYAGTAGLVLPSVPASAKGEISKALGTLVPDRAANEMSGLPLAYNVARANFVPNGINRVILCTDGDFRLGVEDEAELMRLVGNRAMFGVSLSVLGIGMGDAREPLVRDLAVRGGGRYGYVESRTGVERMLAAEIDDSLTTIAKDVKVQVEFNPAKVARYRLIGYENRRLNREDFNDDHVDGGEIGAGHTMTALYEIVPVGAEQGAERRERAAPEDLKYGRLRDVKPAAGGAEGWQNELLTVSVRYKKPDGLVSRKLEFALTDGGEKFEDAKGDFKFAAAVAGFGMILRQSPYRGNATMGDVIDWATVASTDPADDPGGYRREFIGVARRAEALLR